MLDPQLTYKLQLAYAKIGEIGYKIALNLKKGKDQSNAQRELWQTGLKLRYLVKVLNRHVDIATTPPTLYNISEAQVNRMLSCIEKLGKLDRLPVVPTALPKPKPIVINTGQDGHDGAPGQDGTDANIVVEAKPGEDNVAVEVVEIAGVKHYQIAVDEYTAPQVVASFAAPIAVEYGTTVEDQELYITTTKGNLAVEEVYLSDVAIDALLQVVLDLNAVNGNTQPAITPIVIPTVTDTLTITSSIDDGVNTIQSDPVTLGFYKAFLVGVNSSVLTTTHYTALNKIITAKGDIEIPLNGVDGYIYIGFPADYGTIRIYDNDDDEITQEFLVSTVNVTTTGLDTNYTTSYRFYRLSDLTTVNDKVFRIEFES
jgi:hypothetical protein